MTLIWTCFDGYPFGNDDFCVEYMCLRSLDLSFPINVVFVGGADFKPTEDPAFLGTFIVCGADLARAYGLMGIVAVGLEESSPEGIA